MLTSFSYLFLALSPVLSISLVAFDTKNSHRTLQTHQYYIQMEYDLPIPVQFSTIYTVKGNLAAESYRKLTIMRLNS